MEAPRLIFMLTAHAMTLNARFGCDSPIRAGLPLLPSVTGLRGSGKVLKKLH